ncbi:MAG: potassium-transporting ATPase subunit C [Acidimicrobiales bacterium]
MLVHIRRSIVLCVVLMVLTFAYALAGTAVAQVFFKHQADGSLTSNGSTLIGQNWSITRCPGHPLGSCVFQGRPDALGPYASPTFNPNEHPGDDPLVSNGLTQSTKVACSFPTTSSKEVRDIPGESAGTSLGPRSAELKSYTECLVAYWKARGVNPTPDLVTTSGSGYDPDISAADATAEIPMVSRSTGIAPSALRTLIARENNGAQLGFLGSSYINVLQLNEALAKLKT